MNKNIVILIIAALTLVGGYFLLGNGNQNPTKNQQLAAVSQSNLPLENEESQTQTASEQTQPAQETREVIYANSGYVPLELKIKAGDTVVFKNESSRGVWTASAIHPTHTVYDGTSLQNHCPNLENDYFDQCKSSQSGESWSFTFTKTGTWTYHNHIDPIYFGKIIVE